MLRSPKVARLFPDYEQVEREYYRCTGIFPMMHAIAIRKELADRPGLAQATYRAFAQAKEIPAQRYRQGAAAAHGGHVQRQRPAETGPLLWCHLDH